MGPFSLKKILRSSNTQAFLRYYIYTFSRLEIEGIHFMRIDKFFVFQVVGR